MSTATKEKPAVETRVVLAQMITAPEFRVLPDGKKQYLLGCVDNNGHQQHYPVTRDLYLYAAGKNLEGQKPDGLDMLTLHSFHIYVNKDGPNAGHAVALDVIPTKMLSGRFTYTKQEGIEVVTFKIQLGGKVLRVDPLSRPPGMLKSGMLAMFSALRKRMNTGKPLEAGEVLPGIGTIESADPTKLTLTPHKEAQTGRPMYDLESE